MSMHLFKQLLLIFTLIVAQLTRTPLFAQSIGATESATPRIVLILDDMGNNLFLGEQALALPGAINYAFLPHSPNSAELANKAYTLGKEILLHAPMSNLSSKPLGPGALTPIMNRQEFLETLRRNLVSIPHVKGLNNHMGSLLTQLREPMTWLARELKQQDLYFVDSRTSPLTVAELMARDNYLPTLKRDIFLDNTRDRRAISVQFEKLLQLARSQGLAVAIGHPHPETIAFLTNALPTLADRGFQLSLISNALAPQAHTIAIK